MKLKHIFETQTDSHITTKQQALDLLRPWFNIDFPSATSIILNSETGNWQPVSFDLYQISGNLTQLPNTMITRMPFKVHWFIGTLTLDNIKNLNMSLPNNISNLRLRNYQQSNLSGLEEVAVARFIITDCPNLTSINGINPNYFFRAPSEINIENCPNLAFDLCAYTDKYRFWFYDTIPSQMPLVKVITSTSSHQIGFRSLKDRKLAAIIEQYRGKGEVVMRELRNVLREKGYTGHARIT